MKSSVLLLAIAAVALGSCSTVYKTGQTPDDVYYSPARQTEEYVEVKKDQYRSRGYEYDNPDDRYLRMKVRNPYRWNSFDDYYYNDWAYTNSYYGYNSFNPFYSWNTYWSWNSYYNPYCRNIVVVNPKSSPTVYSKVRNFSMGSYVNNNTGKTSTSKSSGVRPTSRYNNSNYNNSNSNNNSLGTSIRKVFSGGNSNSNSGGSYNTSSSNNRPTRTYNPSTNSSSNSSSSGSTGGSRSGGSSGGSSGGGVSRPGRGG